MENNYKYFAFISYNAKDTEWGKKLQKKLEHYKLPATLCSEHCWQHCPIKLVFPYRHSAWRTLGRASLSQRHPAHAMRWL